MGAFSNTLLAMVLAMAMTASYGHAAPTPALSHYGRDVDATTGPAASLSLAAASDATSEDDGDATVEVRRGGPEGSSGLRSRDLAQVLAYAAQSMQKGPNIELGTLGIIIENNPDGRHFPASPP